MSTSPSSVRLGSPFGTLLVRVVIPLWVLVGAGIKLSTRNPKLLPEPVLETIRAIGNLLNVSDPGWWLGISFRTLIGVEIAVALLMIFAPKLARIAASFILTVFLAVLVATMAMAAKRDGISAIWSGSCGCLGSASPPPIVMFAIDALLFGGLLFFKPLRENPKGATWPSVLGALFIGFSVAFVVPDKTIASLPANGDQAGLGPMPTTLEPNYFTTFSEWVGTEFASHPLAQIISRPLPDWINTARFHVVYYRADCEHCHELLETFFHGELSTPVIAVQIPDHDPANELPMPCEECLEHTLPEGPYYVIGSPVLLTVENGVVLSVCEDPEDHGAVMNTIEATASTENQTTPSSSWTGIPSTLEPYYFPEFEEWVGTDLASHPFAQLIGTPVPKYLIEGTGFLVFYRADCEHCHALLEGWFTESVPAPTLAVEVPDADPQAALPFPSSLVDRRVFPEGPDYVIATPALFKVVNGKVISYASDPDDIASIEACIQAQGS
jgi:glutaredoxin